MKNFILIYLFLLGVSIFATITVLLETVKYMSFTIALLLIPSGVTVVFFAISLAKWCYIYYKSIVSGKEPEINGI